MFRTGRGFLLVTTLAVATSFIVACGQGGFNLGSACKVESDNQVEWEQKPTLENRILTMKGTTKNGNRIHNPLASANNLFSFAAFTLHDVQEEGEGGGLAQIGVIYPDEARGKTGSGAGVKLFTDSYDVRTTVLSSSFDIQVEVKERLLDYELAVAVWGQGVGFDTERPIGAECVN